MKHPEPIRPLFRTAKIAAILLLTQVGLHTASAINLTWDTDGATVTDGSGTWSNGGGNWYDGTAATWSNSDPDTAFIGVGGTAGTITITGAGGVTAAGITFNPVASGTYIITGASLTLSPGSTITVNAAAATIDSAIIGNNTKSITTEGPGTLYMTGTADNTSLGVIVGGGTLVLAKSSSGSVFAIGGPGLTVDSGGTLQLGGTTGFDQIYDGATSFLVNSGGVFDMNGRNQTLSGSVNIQGTGIGGNGALINSSGSPSTLTSGVFLAAATTVGGVGNITISGNVTGNTLTKVGANTLTLAGAGDNTSLLLVVDAGTVVLDKSTTGSIWAAGGVTVNNGGTVQLSGTTGFDQIYENSSKIFVSAGGVFDMNGENQTLNNGMNIAGSGAGAGALVNSNILTSSTLTASVTFSGTGGAVGGSGNISINGAVQSGTLTKLGSGTVTLTGSTDDTSLVVVVDAGTLVLAKTSSGSVFAVGGGGATVNGGTLQLGGTTGNDQIYDFATNLTVNSGGAFDMNGRNQTLTSTTPFDLAGSLLNNNASTLSTLTANVVLTGSASIGGLGNLAIPDNITESGGSQSLTKVGSGTVTLSGPSSSYSGPTYVNAGTLTVAGSLANTASGWAAFGGTLEVDGVLNPTATTTDGGTLQGGGTVGAITVSSGGALDPGLDSLSSSAGNLTANGNLLLTDSTSIFSIRLGVATASDHDELTMDSGNVTLNNATLKLTMSGNYANQANGFIYVIINGQPAGSTITGEFKQGISIIAGGELFDIVYGENASDTGSGSDVLLIAEGAAIPEPGTWGMFIGAAAMLLAYQRASAKRPGKIRRVPNTAKT